jgi:hypothetical protein
MARIANAAFAAGGLVELFEEIPRNNIPRYKVEAAPSRRDLDSYLQSLKRSNPLRMKDKQLVELCELIWDTEKDLLAPIASSVAKVQRLTGKRLWRDRRASRELRKLVLWLDHLTVHTSCLKDLFEDVQRRRISHTHSQRSDS